MTEEIKNLKQAEKDEFDDWGTDFVTESEISKIKDEQEIPPSRRPNRAWNSWLPYMLVAFGLLALFSDFNFSFGWWWVFIFMCPWFWGWRGGRRSC